MTMRFLLPTAILAVAAAQQNGDPINNFCRRHQHQTCIIDSKLYLDGGKIYYGGSVNNDSVAQQNTRLLWEDVLDTKNDYKFPTQYSNLTKDPEVPSVSGGVLWPDSTNKLFYLFGGEYENTDNVQSFTTLWLYDVIYNTWNRSSASDGSLTGIKWPAFGAGAITDTGIAYYYGGYLTNLSMPKWGNDRLMLSSLISFNMNTRSWQNQTYDEVQRAEGTMHFIPASDAGMLIYFGGLEMKDNGTSYANMSNIQIFDIANNRWFTQTATGDIPSPRRGHCSGVIWAKDRSSYNFYMYGGIASNDEALDELYILTLPSFQWTLVYPSTVPNYFGGKAWMSCDVIRESQMLIIGGQVPNASMTDCDVPKIGGQHGLLLGQEATEQGVWWHAVQDNTTGYRVPDKIVSLVGGDTDGHATATAPAQGFAIRDLSVYFSRTASASARTASRAIPTATASPSSQPKSKSTTGAIVGGVVGGVLGLAAIIGIVFFWLRRRRTHQQPSQPTPAELSQNAAIDPHDPAGAYKTGASHSMVSPMVEAPAYSPQGWNSELGGYPGVSPQQNQGAFNHSPQQPYYPPPPDPSLSLGIKRDVNLTHEMPTSSTPAVSELPHLRSPVPKRAGY